MKTSVIVTANPKTGQVFTPNAKLGKDGQAYGFLRVEQTTVESTGGIASVRQRSSLYPFKSSDFDKVKDIYTNRVKIDGQIVRKEQLEPRFEGEQHKQVPLYDSNRKPIINADGTTKMRDVLHNGQKIWSKDIYTTNMTDIDELCTPYDVYVPQDQELEEAEAKGLDVVLNKKP